MKMHPDDKRTWKLWFSIIGILSAMYVIQMYLLDNGIGNEITEQPYYYCALIWLVFTHFSSKFEAYFFTHEIRSGFADNFNEHPMFVMIRASVLIPLWILTDWKAVLCYIFMFPFFHDGNYYRWREKIVPGTYPKKYFAQSTTSTAFSTKFMTPVVRISLAIISIVTLIILRYGN